MAIRTIMLTETRMSTNHLPQASLYQLMSWLSPSFPVGAYAYSHGLEFAVEREAVSNPDELFAWIEAAILFGGGRNDAIFFTAAWQAGQDKNRGQILEVAERAAAHRATAEMALENEAQGSAFCQAVTTAWPNEDFIDWCRQIEKHDIPIAYPVAVALAASVAEVPLRAALTAYLHAFAANLVSAGVRLIPLGQTAGQQVLAGLEGTVLEAVAASEERTLDDLGSAVPVIDWASARHETQYTRLFRS